MTIFGLFREIKMIILKLLKHRLVSFSVHDQLDKDIYQKILFYYSVYVCPSD